MPRAKTNAELLAEFLTQDAEGALYLENGLAKGDEPTVVNTVENADWLLMKPAKSVFNGKLIEIGRSDHDQTEPAASFAITAYKLGGYAGPGTDFDAETHVYSWVNGTDSPYVENGAVKRYGLDWAMAHVIRKPERPVEFVKGEILDPEDHTADLLLRAQQYGADLIRQQAIISHEADRVKRARNTVNKHFWGAFYGYAFKIWFAHNRKLAELYYKIANEAILEKAQALHNEHYQKAIDYDRWVAPVLRETRQNGNGNGTDKPDFAKTEQRSVVMTWIDEHNLFTDIKVDLFKLPDQNGAVLVTLFMRQKGGKARELAFNRHWIATDNRMVEDFAGYAAKVDDAGIPLYGVGFARAFLPAS